MSNVDQPMDISDAAAPVAPPVPVEDKGKGKVKDNDAMDEDDDDDDDDDEEDEGDDDEDEEGEAEDDFEEIDPSAVLPQGRRTRGVKVDYTSPEALKKAGLENGSSAEVEEDDHEFVAQEEVKAK